ncbi:MAG: cytochrome c1, partial [Rhizobiales bacterium]|nr:cytochrome c1 [Hyphomicrobiales bacterium]
SLPAAEQEHGSPVPPRQVWSFSGPFGTFDRAQLQRGFPWFIFDIFTQFQEQGPDYIHAIMVGYKEKPPEGFSLPSGSFYNEYFPGHTIAMPPPLSDKQVEYTDGSPTTVDQYAKDVAAFLVWTAEPHMEQRKRIGFQVMIFLLVFAGLLYFTKKKVWADAH